MTRDPGGGGGYSRGGQGQGGRSGGGGGGPYGPGFGPGSWNGGGGTGYISGPENDLSGARYHSGYSSGPEFRHHHRMGSGGFYPGYTNSGFYGYSEESGIGRSQESSGALRNLEAQRAAECLLSTSANSSAANSQHSLHDQIYQNMAGYPASQGSNGGGYPPDLAHPRPPQPGVRFQPQPYFSHLQHRTVYNGSRSFPVIMTDDLVSGTRPNGRMSPVRRTFLLLCTFDLVFLSFLWLISVLVTGKDLWTQFSAQVISYTIHFSMFDIILISFMRFTLCMTFYALLDISHWCVVVFTTVGTVGFLIPKVFEYSWNHNPITYDVSLVLLSFIIAWSEVWYFDFRLVPLESKAKEIWDSHGINQEDERAPLIPSREGGMLQRYIEGSTLYEGSVANFYSPMESLNNSSDEDEDEEGQISEETGIRIPRRFKRKKNKPYNDKEKEYKKTAEEMLQQAWTNLSSSDGWKVEKTLDNGDIVQVKTINRKKVFKLTGYVDISSTTLLEDLFYRVEGMPVWNPNLTDCKIIQPIDEYTDITYQVCAEAAGGVVSTRDFVNLRHWAVMDGTFVSAACSIEHPAMPAQPKKVRGENGPTCYALSPAEGNPERCLFRWLLDTDLKGWIPQSIIDKALSGAQIEFLQFVRQRARVLLSTEDNASSIGSCVDPTTVEE